MGSQSFKLYFVALIPRGKAFDRALYLKQEVAQKYHSKAALRSPPHITLHMPFKWREEKESKIIEVLASVASKQQPFKVRHDGFGSFEPRVIFVNVDKTDELSHFRTHLVREMRRGLNLDNAEYKNQGFHPHMTIAFRDLKKRIFSEAWEFYKDQEFLEEWTCSDLALLKHNGKAWDVFRRLDFGAYSESLT